MASPNVDHAIWFFQQKASREWLLMDTPPPIGTGRRIGSFAQEA